jgi:hypothetical protein
MQLLFAVLTLGPWLLVFAYDFVLYFIRYALWELPVIGGKARGQRRPEPIKLVEHATGHKKVNSISNSPSGDGFPATLTARDTAEQESRLRRPIAD